MKFFESFPSLFLLLLTIISTAIYTLVNNVANREKKYGMMAVASIANGTSQAGIRILLGVFPIIAYGLIVGNAAAHIIVMIIMLVYMRNIFFDKKNYNTFQLILT